MPTNRKDERCDEKQPSNGSLASLTSGNASKAPLFPRESFTVGIPRGHSIDGNYAREAVLSLFALKPGDTDDEFFADYTEAQRSFVEQYGEQIDMIRLERYCDPKTGEARE